MKRAVVIQEHRALVRGGLAVLLAGDANVHVTGTCATGPELVELVGDTSPDVVVLELRPSGWDVAEVVGSARAAVPAVVFVGLHQRREADQRAFADEVGIERLASYHAGFRAVRSAVLGEDSATAPRVERRLTNHGLSRREQQVVAHVAAGLTTSESAAALGLRPKTVEHHKQRIFAKLGVQNQAHAVSIAHQLGVLGDGDAPA